VDLRVLLALSLLLAGCAGQDVVYKPVTADVPVAVHVSPPASLLAPLGITPPEFVDPSDPTASSALTAEGEKRLRDMLLKLDARIREWRNWATGE